MTIDSNSSQPSSSSPTPEMMPQQTPPDKLDGASDNGLTTDVATQQVGAAALESQQHLAVLSQADLAIRQQTAKVRTTNRSTSLITLAAIAVMFLGLSINNFWLGLSGTLVALFVSLWVFWPFLQKILAQLVTQEQSLFIAGLGLIAALIGLLKLNNFERLLQTWYNQLDWGAVGALGEVIGAVGQVSIAVIAVYVAWRQYVISKELTIQQNLLTVQQNLITQQQTIDSYFQGISDLVLDEEGLLEDWPQERAIAEGRTAAILSSVDAGGKAKIIRFLSRSKLLTPLKRDRRLGRAILDGSGGYAEDLLHGVRVIDLGVMLAGADLSHTDLRWTDLSEANLVRANLSHSDLVKTNLARTILYDAQLVGADFKGTRLFYGSIESVTPRSRTEPPNYKTGVHTGAVVENADFTDVQRLSESARYYCCAWGGSKTRATVPGGCEGVPNKLGR